MEKIYASIDVEEYRQGDSIDLALEGWRASPDGAPIDIQVLADGQAAPFAEERKMRPDVIHSVPELSGVSPEVGFALTIVAVDKLWEKYENLQALAVRGEEKVVLWEKSTEEIEKAYNKQTLEYKLDVARPREGRILLQGWVLDAFQEESISVVDEKKNPIPFEMERVVRMDLNKARKLKDDAAHGFEISVTASQVPGNWVVLTFENHLTRKNCRINLKEMYYRDSRRGRLARAFRKERREKNRAYIRKYGMKNFLRYVSQEVDPDSFGQHGWLKRHSASRQELREQRQHVFDYSPLISIVIPLYNTPLKYLKALMDSIERQTYSQWELCLADGSTDEQAGEFIRKNYGKDPRIRYRKLEENKGKIGRASCRERVSVPV